MAHTKAQGAANRTVNVPGKRLGVKKFDGEIVKEGTIIVRQKGTKIHPGENVYMGRDFTIASKVKGIVKYRRLTGHKRNRKIVDVIISSSKK